MWLPALLWLAVPLVAGYGCASSRKWRRQTQVAQAAIGLIPRSSSGSHKWHLKQRAAPQATPPHVAPEARPGAPATTIGAPPATSEAPPATKRAPQTSTGDPPTTLKRRFQLSAACLPLDASRLQPHRLQTQTAHLHQKNAKPLEANSSWPLAARGAPLAAGSAPRVGGSGRNQIQVQEQLLR